MSEPSAEALAAVFQAAGWHYTPDLTTMTPAESRAWKAAAGALDAAVARERERCAEIARASKTEAGLARAGDSDPESKACWLWAFDTANMIEMAIRSGEQP